MLEWHVMLQILKQQRVAVAVPECAWGYVYQAKGACGAGLHIDALDGTTKKDASDPASGHEDHHVRPSPVHPHTIVDCENLLESYLMQVLTAPYG